MGNAVSNQRRERASIKTGHTEDGVLFSITFAKYSDGTVLLEKHRYTSHMGQHVYKAKRPASWYIR